jgi:hypothetical protein
MGTSSISGVDCNKDEIFAQHGAATLPSVLMAADRLALGKRGDAA